MTEISKEAGMVKRDLDPLPCIAALSFDGTLEEMLAGIRTCLRCARKCAEAVERYPLLARASWLEGSGCE